MLAEHMDRVLDEVRRRSSGVADVPPPARQTSDTEPLDAPITEEFRVGTMTIAWDPNIDRVVVELFSTVERRRGGGDRGPPAVEPDEIEADEVFVVKITASYAREFVARAQALVSAGRPPCPFCLQPLDPAGSHLPAGQRLPPSPLQLIRRALTRARHLTCPRTRDRTASGAARAAGRGRAGDHRAPDAGLERDLPDRAQHRVR